MVFWVLGEVGYNEKQMDTNEYYIGEDNRAYVSPTVSRDEQLDFAQNLRDTMGQNTARINAQTQALGTDVPSSLGGLTGSGSYFAQRYQTTPIESQVNTLKATAQAKALNDLMTNYEKQYANKAQQAYRNASRRASTTTTGGGDGASEDGLTFNVNNQGKTTSTKVSTTDWSGTLGKINTTPEGQLYYLDATPTKEKTPTYIYDLTDIDNLTAVGARLGSGYNGQRKWVNGVEYIYLDTGQLQPSWFRVGQQPTKQSEDTGRGGR